MIICRVAQALMRSMAVPAMTRAQYWGFDNSTVGVTADLSESGQQHRGRRGDTYTSIENLSGSNFADILKGDANANILIGNGGADTFVYVHRRRRRHHYGLQPC